MSTGIAGSSIKPLIVAEHASAVFGGEALIPFQYFKQLRQLNIDVHLLVHERTRTELYDAFPRDMERLHFVSDSRINVWCYKIGQYLPDRLAVFTVGAVSHFDTQIRQRRLARSLVRKCHFDLVHEPIPVSPRQPSMMFGLSVPVIIGPMNGGMDYPPNYDLSGLIERRIISVLRWTAAFWNRIMPGKRRAALILVANKRTYDALPSGVKKRKIMECVENGVDLERFHGAQNETEHDAFNVIYVGRLVDFKRVDLMLDACAQLIGKVNFRVHIVGDGPLRRDLETQVRQRSLAEQVRFYGWLPQARAAALLRSSDVMVLPSMRECGGAVVLEAMASSVPVIATEWGGPTDYVRPDTGILIAPGTPDIFIYKLGAAILWMANNPVKRIEMGQAGKRRVQQLYDWNVKAVALVKIYEDVVRAPTKGVAPELT